MYFRRRVTASSKLLESSFSNLLHRASHSSSKEIKSIYLLRNWKIIWLRFTIFNLLRWNNVPREISPPNCNIFSVSNVFKCNPGKKRMISLLLLNHFYRVTSYRRVQMKQKATNYCIRFGRSRYQCRGLKSFAITHTRKNSKTQKTEMTREMNERRVKLNHTKTRDTRRRWTGLELRNVGRGARLSLAGWTLRVASRQESRRYDASPWHGVSSRSSERLRSMGGTGSRGMGLGRRTFLRYDITALAHLLHVRHTLHFLFLSSGVAVLSQVGE